jgi:hypothetical protein
MSMSMFETTTRFFIDSVKDSLAPEGSTAREILGWSDKRKALWFDTAVLAACLLQRWAKNPWVLGVLVFVIFTMLGISPAW